MGIEKRNIQAQRTAHAKFTWDARTSAEFWGAGKTEDREDDVS